MPSHRDREPVQSIRNWLWALAALAVGASIALVLYASSGTSMSSRSLPVPAAPPASPTAPPSIHADQTHPGSQAPISAVIPPVPGPVQQVQMVYHSHYTVLPGDNLTKISRRLGLPSFQSLYAANVAVVGPNPGLIHPGQVLVIP